MKVEPLGSVSFWDATPRAQRFSLPLALVGANLGLSTAIACDEALTAAPDRAATEVLVEVLANRGVLCGRRDDGAGNLIHSPHAGSCARRLANMMLDGERAHSRTASPTLETPREGDPS